MANMNFQSQNSVIILDHTKISTPTNLLIKGTNQAPKRRNLLYKDLFNANCTNTNSQGIVLWSSWDGVNSNPFLQRYGSTIIFNNRGSNLNLYHDVGYRNIKEYLDPATADKNYTLTFRINKVKNLNKDVTLYFFGERANIVLTNGMSGIFSVCAPISTSEFNANETRLIRMKLENVVLARDEEVVVELELLSLELGDHRDDPLLYMPETPFENSIINCLKETPLVSNSSLSSVGQYRLEGEVSLFLQQIEDLIEENYKLFSPSKKELNITYMFLRR